MPGSGQLLNGNIGKGFLHLGVVAGVCVAAKKLWNPLRKMDHPSLK